MACTRGEIALRWMLQIVTNEMSTLVQVMACCLTAPSRYLRQCCPVFMSPYTLGHWGLKITFLLFQSEDPVDGGKAARPVNMAAPTQHKFEVLRLSGSARGGRENVCYMCEEPGQLVTCQGPCLGTFHPDCLGLSNICEATFKCDECLTGKIFRLVQGSV